MKSIYVADGVRKRRGKTQEIRLMCIAESVEDASWQFAHSPQTIGITVKQESIKKSNERTIRNH